MSRVPDTDIFEWRGDAAQLPPPHCKPESGAMKATGSTSPGDPYTFGPQVGDLDLHLFGEGRHRHAHRFLGSHEHETDGAGGVRFAVWAPNAERISVVGSFNRWDGRLAIDEQLGLQPRRPWVYRFKHRGLGRRPGDPNQVQHMNLLLTEAHDKHFR